MVIGLDPEERISLLAESSRCAATATTRRRFPTMMCAKAARCGAWASPPGSVVGRHLINYAMKRLRSLPHRTRSTSGPCTFDVFGLIPRWSSTPLGRRCRRRGRITAADLSRPRSVCTAAAAADARPPSRAEAPPKRVPDCGPNGASSFECSDADDDDALVPLSALFNMHMPRCERRQLPAEGCWVLTEFLRKVFWSGPFNTIVAPAGHHIMEGRLHDRSVVDDYARFKFGGGGFRKQHLLGRACALAAPLVVDRQLSQGVGRALRAARRQLPRLDPHALRPAAVCSSATPTGRRTRPG